MSLGPGTGDTGWIWGVGHDSGALRCTGSQTQLLKPFWGFKSSSELSGLAEGGLCHFPRRKGDLGQILPGGRLSPLTITANLSPVGSHAMEWISPPILETGTSGTEIPPCPTEMGTQTRPPRCHQTHLSSP